MPSLLTMIIDCGTCTLAPSSGHPDAGLACGDCVVSVLLGPAIPELSEQHVEAMAALAEVGLVPPLRLVPRVAEAPRSRRAG